MHIAAAAGGASSTRASGADNPYYLYMGADQNQTVSVTGTSPTATQSSALPSGPTAHNGTSRRLKRAQTPQSNGMLGEEGATDAGPLPPLLPLRAQSVIAAPVSVGAGFVRAPIASPQPLSPVTPTMFTFANPPHLPQLLRQQSQFVRGDYYNVIKPTAQQQPETNSSPVPPTTPLLPQNHASIATDPSNR